MTLQTQIVIFWGKTASYPWINSIHAPVREKPLKLSAGKLSTQRPPAKFKVENFRAYGKRLQHSTLELEFSLWLSPRAFRLVSSTSGPRTNEWTSTSRFK